MLGVTLSGMGGLNVLGHCGKRDLNVRGPWTLC